MGVQIRSRLSLIQLYACNAYNIYPNSMFFERDSSRFFFQFRLGHIMVFDREDTKTVRDSTRVLLRCYNNNIIKMFWRVYDDGDFSRSEIAREACRV